MCCLKLGDEDHILLMLTHHIASDGWSTGILLRELTVLYEAALLGKPAELPGSVHPIRRLRSLATELAAGRGVWSSNWPTGSSN